MGLNGAFGRAGYPLMGLNGQFTGLNSAFRALSAYPTSTNARAMGMNGAFLGVGWEVCEADAHM